MSRQNSFVVGADHPSLPGHFPGEPIVPGAMLLDFAIAHIESCTERRVAAISAAKFYLPVLPDKTCVMTLQVKGDAVSLSATVDGDVAFSLSAQLQNKIDDGHEQEPA